MKRKKRLLYVGNQLTKHGLSPTSADTIPPKLRELGFEVTVVSNRKNKLFRLIDMLWNLFKSRKKVDVVIIDTYSTQNFYYAVAVGKLCRFYHIPYIPILRGGSLPNRLKNSPKLSRELFDNAKTNITPSAYLNSAFKKLGFKNLTYISNVLDIENYRFLERKKLSYNLLWVRSFDEIYNPEMALEIVDILLKEGKEVKLCMVGPDKDGSKEKCRKIAESKNLPVIFTGILQKEEWISLSEEYDIFINTTNFDNMPVSVMEAMALGLPVVSTSVGGMPFLIENQKTGILVSEKDPNKFANAITQVVENKSASLNMSREARKEIEKMDWAKVKQSWIRLLK